MEENTAAEPGLKLWELVFLNCIACGLELVASAAMVYLPPMLLEAGYSEKHMSWVLGLGPFVCLAVVPVMGRWMDTCTSRYGRRIPFMFSLSIVVLVALVFIPYMDHHTTTKIERGSKFSIQSYFLAFGVILIDFGTQAGLTPCEVFLQDITKGLPIRDRAFALYSLMCSVGSCGGYLILSIKWDSTWLGNVFGDQEYCVFSLLAFIFLFLMSINLRTATRIRSRLSLNQNRSYVDLEQLDKSTVTSSPRSSHRHMCAGVIGGLKRLIVSLMPRGIQELFSIPYALRRIVYANFFAWAGLMCFLLFYTDYMGQVVYLGKPSAEVGSIARVQYDEGVRAGSFGLLLHAVMSSFAAPAIEKLEQRYGMKAVHTTSLAVFTVCLMLILVSSNLLIINGLAMLTGVAFASMTTIPFSAVGMYHEDKDVSQIDSLTTSQYFI